MAVFGVVLTGCNSDSSQTPNKPTSEAQKNAYAVGMYIGEKVKDVADENVEVNPDFDVEMYLQGIRDSVKGQPQMAEADAKALFIELQKQVREQKRVEQQRVRDENMAKAQAFLEENKTKEGVQVTDSGLQYRVIKEGTGPSPARADRVSVLYKGSLVDGSVFDSTSNGEPRQFQVNRLVKGWTEALQLMKEGSKYELYLPPELGYGAQDRSKIPANSVLVFELELLKVIPREEPAAAKPAAKK